jgi:hypothetical protein
VLSLAARARDEDDSVHSLPFFLDYSAQNIPPPQQALGARSTACGRAPDATERWTVSSASRLSRLTVLYSGRAADLSGLLDLALT